MSAYRVAASRIRADTLDSAVGAEALRFFEQNRRWWVEVRGGTAAIHRSQKLCRPGEAQAWLDERLAVLRALVRD